MRDVRLIYQKFQIWWLALEHVVCVLRDKCGELSNRFQVIPLKPLHALFVCVPLSLSVVIFCIRSMTLWQFLIFCLVC